VDHLVGIVEDPLGMDREPALEEEVVMDLPQPLFEVNLMERFGWMAADKTDGGDGGGAESEGNSRAFVQATFS
jgi:hypothetical protein